MTDTPPIGVTYAGPGERLTWLVDQALHARKPWARALAHEHLRTLGFLVREGGDGRPVLSVQVAPGRWQATQGVSS